MHWRHEQLTLQMVLATVEHHSYGALRGQNTATRTREGGSVMNYTATTGETPPPEAAGAQYFAMTPDEEGAPAASRPAPMEEVRPQGRDWRHCGSGFELVLNATVPQLGLPADTPFSFRDASAVLFRQMEERSVGQGIAEEIPEVQVPRDPGERAQRQRKVTPQKHISERIPEQIVERGIPQERILERIPEQIVGHGIPQERNSERIPKQIVERGIPQNRTSERIMEQTVKRGIPQERTSERIMEQIVNVPVSQAIPQERISERIAG